MREIIIEHDANGRILRWRPPGAPKLNADATDLEKTVETLSDISGMRVDTSSDPPTLVDDPDVDIDPEDDVVAWARRLDTSSPVQRRKVDEPTKQAFRDARDAGDLQGQLDILFEIVTGEEP